MAATVEIFNSSCYGRRHFLAMPTEHPRQKLLPCASCGHGMKLVPIVKRSRRSRTNRGRVSKIRFSEEFRIARKKSPRRKPAGASFREGGYLGTPEFFNKSDGSSKTNGHPIHSQPLP